MKRIIQNSTCSESSKQRRQKFLRKLKFYSTAAGLGAFTCSSAAQGAITLYDVPDVTITNNLSGISQFIDIHADGPSNPDSSAPEWQVLAPGIGGTSNQIRIGTTFDGGVLNDELPTTPGLPGYGAPLHPAIVAGQGNQLLSLFGFGNPGSSAGPAEANPGYYTESVPAGFLIERATLSPMFAPGIAARDPYTAYNRVNTGRYVGLEWAFEGSGSTNRRYGWAQIDVTPISTDPNPPGFFSAKLTAYAFEMTPNLPIRAGSTVSVPEPGSLALLAAGGGGVALARRRRRS